MKKTGQLTLRNYQVLHIFGDGANPIEREVLTGVLTSLYKVDAAKMSEILADGRTAAEMLADIRTLDATRVTSIKKDTEKASFQEGYKKAKSESLSDFEAKIKEKYGIESDAMGLDLLEAVVAAQTAGKDASTEEAIRKSAAYLKLEREMKDKLKKAEEEAEKRVKETEGKFQKQITFAKVSEKALIILDTLKPVYSSNANVAATHKRGFISELQSNDYELNEGGDIIIMVDGKRKEDAHGHAITFEEHVKAVAANHFEFQSNNGGGNGGNGGDGGNGGGNGYPKGVKKPTNRKELDDIINDRSIPLKDRRAVRDAYEKEYGNK